MKEEALELLQAGDLIAVSLADLYLGVAETVALTPAGMPGRAGVLEGEPEWDCEGYPDGNGKVVGGQLWVRMIRSFPSSNFPLPDQTWSTIRPGTFAVDAEVGVIRCAPVLGNDGAPPNSEQRAEAAAVVLADAMAVLRGVNCCIDRWRKTPALHRQGMFAEQIGVGPAGMCVGTATRVFVGLSNCAC